ncbi:YhgE/Pip domain-containing protein [Microbacterium marinilacus]|uniref:YhgE/Pip domain-containing protein n=1 Tax=Microbacterium marinilacus TaxID=415209 RepID=A0ABP7B6V6_9MICO|nr:YhgE/Pip domain-containing protein [Microbacterium marinilacus]MBY0687449.1 YhgE/Pip domain-containing protein [Microbacterium marinilacus]
MTFLTLVRTELKRLVATPMAAVALTALMLVPVLYAGLYLWGNDDPYGNLHDVPVALVVQDEGTTSSDAELAGDGSDESDDELVVYGDEVRDQLLDDGTVGWDVVSADAARDGLRVGTYDFVVTLGPEFSDDLVSAAGDDPRQAVIELTTNDANSYLAGTIADQVTAAVKASLTREVGEEAARTLLDGIATIRSSIADAADGARQLADGADSAKSGADTLADGAGTAADGAAALAAGLATLDDNTRDLPAQTQQLADGARQVADGNAQLSGTVQPIADEVARAVADAPSDDDIRSRLDGVGLTSDQVKAVLGIVTPVRDDLESANDRVQSAADDIAALADGSAAVADGTAQLAAATPALADGIASADQGAASLSSGTRQLADGSDTLASGLADLDSGAAELRDGLASGLDRIPDQDEDERSTAAAAIADPVRVQDADVAEASSYGAGMAPFFISLSAWIGIYALFLIVKPYSKRAVTALRRPLPIAAAAWTTPAVLGAVQMVAVFGIITVALGYSVAHPWGMVGFMALTSATYAAIILTLNLLLGSVGQFLGLVLMVLQLVSAGGTFPWQTLPPLLRTLHEALPMSHAVDGIRQLMYGGDLERAQADALFLAVWLIGSLVVAYLSTLRMTRTRTMRDLRPSLIG